MLLFRLQGREIYKAHIITNTLKLAEDYRKAKDAATPYHITINEVEGKIMNLPTIKDWIKVSEKEKAASGKITNEALKS